MQKPFLESGEKHFEYEVSVARFDTTDLNRPELLGNAGGNRAIAVLLFCPKSKETVRNQEHPQAIKHKLPLLLFNHGYCSSMEANTYLCSEIAANGYYVASIGHPYESTLVEFEDGTRIECDETIQSKLRGKEMWKALRMQKNKMKSMETEEEKADLFDAFQDEYATFLKERVREWSSDSVCALKEIKSRYGDLVDFSRGVAASGHSYGGAVALDLCLTKEEISCGLNMDGLLFGNHKGIYLQKPFYHMCCEGNLDLASQLFVKRRAPLYLAEFRNMKHAGFTDMKAQMPDSPMVGKLSFEVVHRTMVEAHVSFLDKYLKGKDVSVNQSIHPDVRISVYE